jgi:predicted nucleic acid-binding protein
MASYLLDTNVILRTVHRQCDGSEDAKRAVATLTRQGHLLWLTPQVLIEFYSVATRPIDVNGLGWDPEMVEREIAVLQLRYPLLEEGPAVFPLWLDIVRTHRVRGKKAHDARLAAVMQAHAVENLLTFNVEDFAAFPNVKAVHPTSLV